MTSLYLSFQLTAARRRLVALAAQAYAAIPEEAKTAIEGAKADGIEAGWLVIGAIAALFVFSLVRRVLR